MADRAFVARTARIIAVVGWVVFGGVLLRVASGGGTLRGVGYVLGTESPVVVLLLAASLISGSLAIFALVRDLPSAWAISSAGAGIALATSALLGIDGHRSALLAALASGLVLLVGIAVGLRRKPGG